MSRWARVQRFRQGQPSGTRWTSTVPQVSVFEESEVAYLESRRSLLMLMDPPPHPEENAVLIELGSYASPRCALLF